MNDETKMRLDLWQLREFLVMLQTRAAECIEYGWSDHEHNADGFYSRIRIRYMPTAGGIQFCLKTIYSGVEGSGFYTPNLEAVFEYARKTLDHFHRPTLMHQKLNELRARYDHVALEMEYEWFVSDGTQTKYHTAAIDRLNADMDAGRFLPGAQAVALY